MSDDDASLDDRTTPRRFDYDEQARALLVEWRDGTEHRIPFGVLRRACPCAECHGEMGHPGRFHIRPLLSRGEDELADIHLVGSYGLGARWADGHSTGIYTFESLRRLGEEQAAPRPDPAVPDS